MTSPRTTSGTSTRRWLIRQGADVKLVQARMGHRSATTTLDTYGHLWPDSDERTRTAIDTAFDKVLTTVEPEGPDEAKPTGAGQ
jgi:hypothetical protein